MQPTPKLTIKTLDAPPKGTTIEDLPMDIASLVLDYLTKDKKNHSLKTCSCLSRSWRALVLPRLFAAIGPLATQEVSNFMAFLQSRPHLVPMITEVRIYRRLTGPFDPQKDFTSLKPSSPFVSLVNALPALQVLHCSGLIFCLDPTSVGRVLGSCRLRRFVWNRCSCSNIMSNNRWMSDFSATLALFKTDMLDMTVPWEGKDITHEKVVIKDPVPLRVLILRVIPHMPAVLSSLRQTLMPNSLRSLTLTVGEPDLVPQIGEFLHDVGSKLEFLRLNFPTMHTPERWPGTVLKGLSLKSCPHLSVLDITMLWGPSNGRDYGRFSARVLAAILKQTPPSVQEIRIPIFPPQKPLPPNKALDVDQLRAVQQILERHTQSKLRALVFILASQQRVDEYRHHLEEVFMDLHLRGVLRLENMDHRTLNESIDGQNMI